MVFNLILLFRCVLRYTAVVVSLIVRVSSKVERVLTNDQGLDNAAQTLSNLMDVLIKTKQLKGVGAHTNYIDIVRDVINLVPVYWLSNDIVCICYFAKLDCSQSCLRLGSL